MSCRVRERSNGGLEAFTVGTISTSTAKATPTALQTAAARAVATATARVAAMSAPAPTVAPAPVSIPVSPYVAPVSPFELPQQLVYPPRSSSPVCSAYGGGGSVAQGYGTPGTGGEKLVQCYRDTDDFLSPFDAYAQGSFQGLQRQLVLYGQQKGLGFSLVMDGRLTKGTLDLTMAVLQNGLPPGMAMPADDEDICEYSRTIARFLAASTGEPVDFTPREPTGMRINNDAAPPAEKKKFGLITAKQAIFGGLLIGGVFLLARR